MLCSFLIPTRFRFEKLKRSISSILETADNPLMVDIIVRVHRSDHKTRDRISEIGRGIIVKYRDDLEPGEENTRLWNDLLPFVSGKWIQPWSDDMVLKGQGWDTQLAALPTTGVVAHPEIHQLNESVYSNNVDGPTPFIPRDAMTFFKGSQFPVVPDMAIYNTLVAKHQWKVEYLKGITVWHDREIDATLPADMF